jgi:aryl-alcohol dehydrogenase (NADP+)
VQADIVDAHGTRLCGDASCDCVRDHRPRSIGQLDGLLAGVEVILDDELLDQIDKIVPPGVDVAPLEGAAYSPPSITEVELRRRSTAERAAA